MKVLEKGENMYVAEIIITSVALSSDAFAAALCEGLTMKRIYYRKAILVALFFGIFQAFMPLAGWYVGNTFERYVSRFDHLIAFILLTAIGLGILFEGIKKNKHSKTSDSKSELKIRELLVLSVATSIDAFSVGISLACLGANIILSVALIGTITFVLSFIGVIVGNNFGEKYEKSARIFGGSVLILIGIKILIEHVTVI